MAKNNRRPSALIVGSVDELEEAHRTAVCLSLCKPPLSNCPLTPLSRAPKGSSSRPARDILDLTVLIGGALRSARLQSRIDAAEKGGDK